MPHIYAQTEAAGYYGLGYAQAEDQGERFLRMIMTSLGRLSELDGTDALARDIEMRRWMIPETSREGFGDLSPPLQANYRAFADGFNRYFREHVDRRPTWSFEIEPWHLVAVPRGLLWMFFMVNHGYEDCRRGGSKLAQGSLPTPWDEVQFASNEWVIHPQRTADKAMIVVSDPHGPVDGGLFYEYRMHAGQLESAGYTLGGMMLLAHTRYLSWGQTTGSPDVSDCYAVETDADNPRRFLFDGLWEEMTVRAIEISVKDGGSRKMTFEYTRHNGVMAPVIGRDGHTAYVVATPYMTSAAEFDEEVYRLNLARNVAEAKDAMRKLGIYTNNLMVGDSSGNSWFLRAGRTPRRPDGFDWTKPVPGNTSKSAWQGLHSIDDLVQVSNPSQGYMQNNNLSPDEMASGSKLVNPADYPSYVFNDQPGRITSRGVRARQILDGNSSMTVEDAIDMVLDEKWPLTENWLSALRLAASDSDATRQWMDESRRMLKQILSFDGHARKESTQALDYLFWRETVFALLGPEKSETLISSQWTTPVAELVPASVLLQAVESAVSTIRERFGKLDVALGDYVRIDRSSRDLYGNFETWIARMPPIEGVKGDAPVGGIVLPSSIAGACYALPCEFTLRAFSSAPQGEAARAIRIISGSRILRLTVFTVPIQSFTLHSPGQSDDPDSPHYDDQMHRLLSGRHVKPVYFERSQLEGHIESRATLVYQ